MTPGRLTRDARGGRLDVRGLSVSYDGAPALRRVTLACEPGEIVGVVGPNGAGKSTLVKAVLGLVHVDEGTVLLDGEPVARQRRRLAYLPQRSAVDWDYPAVVQEVVTMGCYVQAGLWRRLTAEHRARVRDALERVGLTPLAGRPIGELSGGQQQRMLLARALAQSAGVLLLDEPFAGVDALTEQLLWAQLRALASDGATVVIVNHDLTTVSGRYDRLAILARRLVAFGPVAHVFTRERIAEAYGAAAEPSAGAWGEP